MCLIASIIINLRLPRASTALLADGNRFKANFLLYWGLAVIVLAGGLSVTSTIIHMNDVDLHAQNVATWLKTDYGIEVSATQAQDLLNGKTLQSPYKGTDRFISLVPNTSGGLSVRGGSDAALPMGGSAL